MGVDARARKDARGYARRGTVAVAYRLNRGLSQDWKTESREATGWLSASEARQPPTSATGRQSTSRCGTSGEGGDRCRPYEGDRRKPNAAQNSQQMNRFGNGVDLLCNFNFRFVG